jgi:uncharacterized protein
MVCRCRCVIFAGFALSFGCVASSAQAASACVWKVTASDGKILYLGGSIHVLRQSDYPLPAAYDRAFNASNRLALEVKPRDLDRSSDIIDRTGKYPGNDNLKNHVDPRTYEYLKRFFNLFGISEEIFSKYRPWYLADVLESASTTPIKFEFGVERFLQRRAERTSKPIVSLESAREHAEVFSGLSERGSEALLLITLIPADKSSPDFGRRVAMWRRGEADALTSQLHQDYHDFPAMADRLLDQRNRRWIPRIEEYLRSGKIYFVVAGAAHMGGPSGVPNLLRERGYKVEQL